MIETTIQNISYMVEVSPNIWKILNGFDDEGNENDDQIIEDLMNFGAYDVNWNGHFGMAVFFSLTTDDHSQLSKIENYIECLKYRG